MRKGDAVREVECNGARDLPNGVHARDGRACAPALDWRKEILEDARPLKEHFPSKLTSQRPILMVQVHESRHLFITNAM